MKRVDQVLPALVYGDAIGNHTMEIRRMLRERGIASTIYAQYIDPRYAHAAKSIDALEDEPNRVLIYHFSIGSPVTKKLLTFTHSTLADYYHNITPAKFFDGVNPQLAAELRMGRDQLQLLTRAPIAIAASEFNRREMIEAGFADVQVAHYLVDFARLDAGARGAEAKRIRARYKDDRFTIAFVGRVAPNKCQHDLIHLVNYYRTLIDRSVRLLLVGNFANAGGYHTRLQMQIQRMNLHDTVELAGPVGTDDGLGAIYQRADAFVCMSEHEGFCVPIIEAMHFEKPVFAYASTGVPFTMGDSGILFTQKKFEWIAECVEHVHTHPNLKNAIVQNQTQRLRKFSIERTRADLAQILDALH